MLPSRRAIVEASRYNNALLSWVTISKRVQIGPQKKGSPDAKRAGKNYYSPLYLVWGISLRLGVRLGSHLTRVGYCIFTQVGHCIPQSLLQSSEQTAQVELRTTYQCGGQHDKRSRRTRQAHGPGHNNNRCPLPLAHGL